MWDEESLPPTKPAWPRLTPSASFRTFVQSHLLGTQEFSHRWKGAQLCLYAWDIALLPDQAAREREIERLWQTCEPLTPKPLPEGFAIGFRQEMRNLVALKRDLLPTVWAFIANAQLEAVDEATDRLIVTTEAGVEEFSIHCRPDPAGTPSFGQRLSRLHNDTDDLADWVFEMRRRRQLTHEDAAEVAVLCGMRRVELAGYRELSALWNAKQTAPSAKRVTGEWMSMADETDGQIKEILAALG